MGRPILLGLAAREMKKTIKYSITALVVLALGLAGWHFFAVHTGSKELNSNHKSDSTIVSAVRASRGSLARTIRLTAEFRPYQEIDVHAKVAGFIQSIPVDIGDQVKEGGIIATLEVPELQEDVKRAAAGVQAAHDAVNQAQANYQAAHDAFTRLQQVAKEHANLVAQQEVENARAKDKAAAAALESAKDHVTEALAEQSRQMALVDYSKITAPFNGVVTRRYADVGALIQAGTSSSTQGTAVIRFAQEDVVRTLFPVPESAVAAVRQGVPVKIDVSGLGRTLEGKVTRFSRHLDPETRTMETEVDLPNADLSITPGMYGWVELTVEQRNDVLNVPVEAIAPGPNPTVYLINQDDKVEERPVKIGIKTANRVEILSGLQPGDLVFIGNRSQVPLGEKVTPRIIDTAQAEYGANNG